MAFWRKKNPHGVAEAETLLAAAAKVRNYRGDLFDDSERERLRRDEEALRNAETREDGEAAAARLKETLSELGGTIFPQKTLPEWVELIVVAAILAGGVRGFFFQLFKIPTNSMFPTYNGMTAEVFTEPENALEKWAERVFRSASFHEFIAPASGEIVFRVNRKARVGSKDVFEVFVGGVPVEIECPRDFSMDSVFLERFFPKFSKMENLSLRERWAAALENAGKTGKVFRDASGATFVRTGISAEKGENFLSFKIFGGDMVVVNRFAYHFMKPEVGDPFVFRTKNIPGLNNVDLYYIKRLAGTPRDVLSVRDKKLYRNGNLISGADAFDKNNEFRVSEKYYGYLPSCGGAGVYAKPLKNDFHVPADSYYALGDNSGNSYDSRGWGCVPAEDAVGKASFIIYPFSERWGIAK